MLQPKQHLQSASFTTQVLATPNLLARLLRLSFTSWCLGWLGTLPCRRCSEYERRTPRHPCPPGCFGYGPCQPDSVAFLTSRAWLLCQRTRGLLQLLLEFGYQELTAGTFLFSFVLALSRCTFHSPILLLELFLGIQAYSLLLRVNCTEIPA